MNTDNADDYDAEAAALELIKALAPDGHSLSYLAGALRRALIPTKSGRGTWHQKSVQRLVQKHGLKVGYGT